MRAHQCHHPALREPLTGSLAGGIYWCYLLHNPAHHAQDFRGFERAIPAVAPNAPLVKAIVVKRFAGVHHPAAKRHPGPELPVTAEAQTFVRSTDLVVASLTKNSGARVANKVRDYEVTATFLGAVRAKVRRPARQVRSVHQGVNELVQLSGITDAPGPAVGDYNLWVCVEQRDQTLQETRVGVVVGFGEPDVFSLSEPDAFVPLFEGAAGIDFVEFSTHAGIG